MSYIARIFRLLGKEEREHALTEPGRRRPVVRASGIQPVSKADRLVGVEPKPVAEFIDECGIVQLPIVRVDHMLEDALASRRVHNQHKRDPIHYGGPLQSLQIVDRHGPAIIKRPRGLTPRDRTAQIDIGCGSGREVDGDRAAFACVERNRRRMAIRACRDRKILRGAPQADEKVVIVWINDGCTTRKIRLDRYPSLTFDETPRLGVVHIRRERRVADEIPYSGIDAWRCANVCCRYRVTVRLPQQPARLTSPNPPIAPVMKSRQFCISCPPDAIDAVQNRVGIPWAGHRRHIVGNTHLSATCVPPRPTIVDRSGDRGQQRLVANLAA